MESSRRRILPAFAPAALALLALAGCGGGDEPTRASVATQTITRTVTVGTVTESATGTSTAPSPPANQDAPLSLHAAEQTLGARAYAPLGERDWRPDQRLKVLLGVGRPTNARAELAFLFVGDRFIGTDTSAPSARIEVVAQDDDSVTLRYALYRPGDAIDAPTGGSADVTYAWDGTRLVAQDPIPSADPDAALSRR